MSGNWPVVNNGVTKHDPSNCNSPFLPAVIIIRLARRLQSQKMLPAVFLRILLGMGSRSCVSVWGGMLSALGRSKAFGKLIFGHKKKPLKPLAPISQP